MNETTQAEFVADGATIATNKRVLAKMGRLEVREGHLGLFRENGDLIASGSVADVVVKKTLFYFAVPTILLTVDGQKFRVNLTYETYIAAGLDDGTAKERQSDDNERFFTAIRRLGGQA